MTKRLINFFGYVGALVRFVVILGLNNGTLLLASLAALKWGVKPGDNAAALLECWTYFRNLQRDRRIRVTAAGPSCFQLSYSSEDGAGADVRMALRMPASVSSDPGVFNQIFVEQEYLHVIGWFARIRAENINTILDVGANIGCAAIFFRTQFPGASIFCLEPEPGNYQRLRLNLEMNPQHNIRSLQAAIWARSCKLICLQDFRDRKESSFRFVESDRGDDSAAGVKAVDIQTLADEAGFAAVDLLKLDVEGAEAALLRDAGFTGFLESKVARVAVEVHEEFISINEARCVLDSLGFETGVVDEFVVGIRRR